MNKFLTGIFAALAALGLFASPLAAQTGESPRDFKLQPKEAPRVDPRLQGPEIDKPSDTKPAPQRVQPPPMVVQPRTESQPQNTAQPAPQRQVQQRPAERAPQPATRTVAPSSGQPPAAAPSATTTTPTSEVSVPDVTETPTDTAPVTAPDVATTAPAATPEPANDNQGGFPWWLAGLGLLALGLFGGFLWGRGRRKGEGSVAAPQHVAPKAERTAPIPRPVPVPAPKAKRAWIEIEFEPLDARSTPMSASLAYRLIVRNRGDAPAKNITIDALMTGAGNDQDAILTRFYAQEISQPIAEIQEILADGEGEMAGKFELGMRDIHPIRMADRVIFVPLVAFSVRYERGDGEAGHTAQAFIIGRESNPPTEKMGPFRLDLGPRHYKSVGKRAHKSARRA